MKKQFRKFFIMCLTTITMLAILPGNTTHAQESLPPLDEYYFHSSWGGEGKQLLRPTDIAVADDGKIYIVNMEFNRITILDQNGYVYNEIGGFGEEDGEFNLPRSVAINDAGEIFVSDSWNRRMQKFDSNGNHLLTFGEFGDDVGQIWAPQGIAIDSNGDLLVADSNKIIKFSPYGEFISEVGSPAHEQFSGDYDFYGPSDVVIDEAGNIYVVDSGNYRIQIFDSDFTYLDTINITDDGYEAYPNNAAIDDNLGRLYVTVNSKIYIFDSNNDYNPLGSWGGEGTELGQLRAPTGIFVDPYTGYVYVTEDENHRVSVFNNDGTIKTAFGTPNLINGYFDYPRDIAINNNEVYITDELNHRVQVFNKDGTFLRKWGEFGVEDGKFDSPWGIDTDSFGNVYVVDSNNYRLQKFDLAGNWLVSHDLTQYFPEGCFPSNYEFPICHPRGIAIDSNNNIFITLSGYNYNYDDGTTFDYHVVYKFDSNFNKTNEWENGGASIAVDAAGIVYTTWANYVYVFSNDGVLLDQWGEGPGPYKGMSGLEVDAYGDVYTMEAWYGIIKKYTNNGTLLGSFGSLGNDPGQFAYGGEMAITEDGLIYVVDSENQRIQVIAPTLPEPDPDSGLVLNGDFDGTEQVTQVNILTKPTLLNDMITREADPGLEFWVYGGLLDVTRTSAHTYEGMYALQLGGEVNPAVDQGITDSWAYQVFYVRPDWYKPVLKFNYNVFTNDNIAQSNFIAEIQDGVGLNNLDVIVLDGYQGADSSDTPEPGTDLGWKQVEFDLSPYRGQHIRLVFSNRNLYPDSQGIWSFVEKVQIVRENLLYMFPVIYH